MSLSSLGERAVALPEPWSTRVPHLLRDIPVHGQVQDMLLHSPGEPKGASSGSRRWKKIASHLGRLWQVTLSGGEPFLREDLDQICSVFSRVNSARILTIPTNSLHPKRSREARHGSWAPAPTRSSGFPFLWTGSGRTTTSSGALAQLREVPGLPMDVWSRSGSVFETSTSTSTRSCPTTTKIGRWRSSTMSETIFPM